ncbi:MAG: YraN family protein [Planctomycetia bacterium]|nr:MAG: YraN family protein [Planctomycetia bacterium]
MAFWNRKELGDAGETLACKFLKKSGYRILARNYRCPAGEIDIVCSADGVIAFVEVKTRVDDSQAAPENNIRSEKKRHIERTARFWIAQNGRPDTAYRFDAISIVMPEAGDPIVRHIVDAFRASGG